MEIKNSIIIKFTETDLKKIIQEYVKRQGYRSELTNIKFDIGTVYRGYGLGEYSETILRGCTVDCCGLDKAIYEEE